MRRVGDNSPVECLLPCPLPSFLPFMTFLSLSPLPLLIFFLQKYPRYSFAVKLYICLWKYQTQSQELRSQTVGSSIGTVLWLVQSSEQNTTGLCQMLLLGFLVSCLRDPQSHSFSFLKQVTYLWRLFLITPS